MVVVASELFGVPWWVGLGIAAVVLVVIGVLGRASRPARTSALLGYGGLAVTALYLTPRIGAVLVALTVMVHGVWDVIHYRRNQVVPRSLAEFCVFPDIPSAPLFSSSPPPVPSDAEVPRAGTATVNWRPRTPLTGTGLCKPLRQTRLAHAPTAIIYTGWKSGS
ncbi:MAG: hypothetical protein ACRDRV_07145 [Pseudonocardiaceae bacterium]